MTTPLALILFENLLLGNQVVNKMHDLGYRVQSLHDVRSLEEVAIREKPLLIVADLVSSKGDVGAAISHVKKNSQVSHIPILAFAPQKNVELQKAARKAGADLVSLDTAMLDQLPQLLDQVLQVD